MYLNKHSIRRIVALLAGLLGLTILFIGKSLPVNASQLNFSVEPVLPENQYDTSHTYFDLLVKSGQTQELVINLKNDTKNEVVVIPEINPATTNINGVVEYGASEQSLNDTAQFNIADLLKSAEKEIVIPAEGEKQAKFSLTIPDETIKGVIAGGITLKEKENSEEKKETDENQGLAIENKYAYVVATVLRESEEVEKSLELVDVTADQVNARNVINAELKNPAARYLNQLKVETKIMHKNSDDVLYSTKKEDMQMAPNSSFQFPTKLEGKKLEAGDYTLELEANSGDKKWSFSKNFTISGKKAENLNKKDVTIEEDNTTKYLIMGLIFLLLILIVIAFVYYLKKRKNHEEK